MERSWRIGAVVVLALGLTACTTGADDAKPSGPVVQLGAPGEPNRTLSPEEAAAAAAEAPTNVEADMQFMRDMIVHHDQALVMTGYVEDRTEDRDIRLLAERMRISQEDETSQMTGWLQDRGQPLRDEGHSSHGGGHENMPGMLTEEQLAALESAEGEQFERLFLESMVQHHLGAIEMVADLYASGGGLETTIDQFARHVESDQNIEIGRMQQMLVERAS